MYDSEDGGIPTDLVAIFFWNLWWELRRLQRSPQILSQFATRSAGNFITDPIHV